VHPGTTKLCEIESEDSPFMNIVLSYIVVKCSSGPDLDVRPPEPETDSYAALVFGGKKCREGVETSENS